MSYASYVCVAVMHSNELQFVCEGKPSAWGVENKVCHAYVMREEVKTQQSLGMELTVLCRY